MPPDEPARRTSITIWFQARAAWPVREAPVSNLVRARIASRKTLPAAPVTADWESIGPTNIGGRLTSIVCHPTQPDRIWVGAAGGGVWYSPDGGRSWISQWHSEDSLNVGSLAIDSRKPNIIYCGTGEANLSADSYAGVGIYRTLDSGATWHLLAPSDTTGVPRRIGVIAIDPFDSSHLALGGIGYGEAGQSHDLGGLYTSHDGGVTWTRSRFVSPYNYWCHSVVFHPTSPGTLFVTVTARGVSSGVYRSTDGGQSWTHLTKGFGPSERTGRTTLALSPSNPKVLYALVADEASEFADQLLGVFRSGNRGDTWTNVAGRHFVEEGQMSYGNTIAVHPKKPNHVICGGVDLHLSTNGGRTWRQVSHWDGNRGDRDYAHADHHALLMPVGAPGRVYDPNDGGLDVSEDGGKTWVNRSNGLAVTMYYDLDCAQSDGQSYGGGAQDNGTLVTTTGHAYDHFELLGGDGGWIAFDPVDAGHVYASYQQFNIYRFRQGANKRVSPPAPESERNFVWMCFIKMDPNDANTIFTGSYRVWRTRDDSATWKAVSPALDDSQVSAIEIARTDSKRLYVGTENGKLFRSLDGGNTWSANLSSALLPGHSITRLAASPMNPDVVYATFANFGHSHVFRSKDGALTWEDLDKGRLPDVPHHSIAIPADDANTVFVCSDAGVFVSRDGGQDWMNVTRNLPNVMVVDLVHHLLDGTLMAATYGRGLWRLRLKQI
ncbi:MAG: hypothetical protein LC791_12170 [Acidobacteria bacterium]|nr:hypothetical protein [Acidobacteriota bacterium]